MIIHFKSLHNLNLEADELVRKEINEDFESYLREYITFSVTENDTKRDYSIPDENTTVVHCVSEILSGVLSHSESIYELGKFLNISFFFKYFFIWGNIIFG